MCILGKDFIFNSSVRLKMGFVIPCPRCFEMRNLKRFLLEVHPGLSFLPHLVINGIQRHVRIRRADRGS